MRRGLQLEDYTPAISVRYDRFGRITSGLVVGDVLRQNQALLLTLHPGELKEAPVVGVGIGHMLLDHNPLQWRALIREQLERDGQTVESITMKDGVIDIAANYEEE